MKSLSFLLFLSLSCFAVSFSFADQSVCNNRNCTGCTAVPGCNWCRPTLRLNFGCFSDCGPIHVGPSQRTCKEQCQQQNKEKDCQDNGCYWSKPSGKCFLTEDEDCGVLNCSRCSKNSNCKWCKTLLGSSCSSSCLPFFQSSCEDFCVSLKKQDCETKGCYWLGSKNTCSSVNDSNAIDPVEAPTPAPAAGDSCSGYSCGECAVRKCSWCEIMLIKRGSGCQQSCQFPYAQATCVDHCSKYTDDVNCVRADCLWSTKDNKCYFLIPADNQTTPISTSPIPTTTTTTPTPSTPQNGDGDDDRNQRGGQQGIIRRYKLTILQPGDYPVLAWVAIALSVVCAVAGGFLIYKFVVKPRKKSDTQDSLLTSSLLRS